MSSTNSTGEINTYFINRSNCFIHKVDYRINGLIQDYAVELDVEKIKEYIIENKGVTRDEAEAMSDEEIKKQYTDEKVFMKASVTIVDVMEDINLEIAV